MSAVKEVAKAQKVKKNGAQRKPPDSGEVILPTYGITPWAWLRMMKMLDNLTGNRVGRTLRFIMWVLGLILVIYIAFLAVQVIGGAVSVGEHGLSGLLRVSTSQSAENLLGILLNLFTVAFTGVTALQIYLMKDIDHQGMSHQVFEDNQEYRRDSGNARYQLKLLAEELRENTREVTRFEACYVKDSFRDMRAFAFHHEYIGHLVYRNRLNFGITFDTITFPNWLITSDDAKVVINAGRTAYSDFWLGSYYLYLTYEVRRKYNSLYFARRLKPGNREEVKHCKKAFRYACRQWKKHYRAMPPQ